MCNHDWIECGEDEMLCLLCGQAGIAAVNLGFNYIGIELDEQYVEIARRRINAVGAQFH